jgi:hypothetical protein
MSEFERSMDEARKLSAKKIDSEESKLFSEKVDWAYGNLVTNMQAYLKARDSRNVAALAHMMVWMKPDSPLGWYYKARAITMDALAAGKVGAKKAGSGPATPSANWEERRQAIAQAWKLYDANPDDQFSKRFRAEVGKELNSARLHHVWKLFESVIMFFGALGSMAVILYYKRDFAEVCIGATVAAGVVLTLFSLLYGLANVFYLASKNERNFM